MSQKIEDWKSTKQKLVKGDLVRKELQSYFCKESKNLNTSIIFLVMIVVGLLVLLIVHSFNYPPNNYNVLINNPTQSQPILKPVINVEVPTPIVNVPEKEVKVNVDVRKVGDGLMIEYDDGSKKFYEGD